MNDQDLTDRFRRAAQGLPDPARSTVDDVRARARQRQQRRSGLVAAAVAPLVVLGGFAVSNLAAPDPSVVISPHDGGTQQAWDGRPHPQPGGLVGTTWSDASGEQLPETVARVNRGVDHCGWQDALLLNLGWPLGTESTSMTTTRQYVRDPTGVLPDPRPEEKFATGRQLPDGGVDTGYRVDNAELWFGPDRGDEAAFFKFPDRVERWPRDTALHACM